MIRTKDGFYCVLSLSPEEWEKLKKTGDKQLYKKKNKYADYTELRIMVSSTQVEIEGHCIKENEGKK